MKQFCVGCYGCVTPCGREEGVMECKINYEKEYAYYSVMEDTILTLHVKIEVESPYLILLGEV